MSHLSIRVESGGIGQIVQQVAVADTGHYSVEDLPAKAEGLQAVSANGQ